MSSHPLTRHDARELIRVVNSTLIVKQLQHTLKTEGQPTSGLKAPLQKRLTNYIEAVVDRNDMVAFQRLKNNVFRPDACNQTLQPHYLPLNGYTPGVPAGPGPYHYSHPSGTNRTLKPRAEATVARTNVLPGSEGDVPRIIYRESPFYTVLAALSKPERCPVSASHRNSVTVSVRITETDAQQLTNDKSYRCMVYCTALDSMTPFTRDTDIAFPHQVELRVNEVVVNGLNLRGLKNKPGSTRPADITDKLTITPNTLNFVTLTYAMTQKEYAIVVNLVKAESVDNLVAKLQSGRAIAKETVIAELVKKNLDSDLVATSTIMSLKCPLSTLRIDLPVRSSFCTHVQCFDATSFLQLQQQAPTWSCPTCNRSISFGQLVIDRYFDDILNSTPKTVESVTIDADGNWSAAVEPSKPSASPELEDNAGRKIVDLEDEVGLVRLSDTPGVSSSREVSLPTARTNGTNGNKRSFSQVIDLTLSSDDEESVPARSAKRPNQEGIPSLGYPNGNFQPHNAYSP